MLQQLPLVLVQGQTVRQVIAALDELGGAEPGREDFSHGVVPAVLKLIINTVVRLNRNISDAKKTMSYFA